VRGLVAAWVAGEAVYIWRDVHKTHGLPVPGVLLGITGLFALLGAAAEVFPQAATVITLTAWGLDVAGFFSAVTGGLGKQIGQAEQVQAQTGA
jgi:hypothetical protein